MRKLKLGLGIFVAAAMISLTWAGIASAHVFRTGTNVSVDENQKIEHSLFVSGQTIVINSEVEGDVFCAGQTVTISGTIHGDVICAAQTLTINGTVEGDIRVAAQTLAVGAEVEGSATVASQLFNLESRGSIGQDVSVMTEDANLSGSIGRDLAVTGRDVSVGGEIGRDIKGEVERLKLTSEARVNGNIEYTSENDIDMAEGADVTGEITRRDAPKESKFDYGAVFGVSVTWILYWLLAMLMLALALVLLFPRFIHNVSSQAVLAPWRALLTGVVACLLVPLILIILTVTVIGIPLALIFSLAWLVVLLISGPLTGYYLGRLVMRDSLRPVPIMLVGVILLMLLYFIPIVGLIAILATSFLGPGMLLQELFRNTPRPMYNLEPVAASGGRAKKRN